MSAIRRARAVTLDVRARAAQRQLAGGGGERPDLRPGDDELPPTRHDEAGHDRVGFLDAHRQVAHRARPVLPNIDHLRAQNFGQEQQLGAQSSNPSAGHPPELGLNWRGWVDTIRRVRLR